MVISHSYVSLPEGIHNDIYIAESPKKFLMNFPFPVVKILVKHPMFLSPNISRVPAGTGNEKPTGPVPASSKKPKVIWSLVSRDLNSGRHVCMCYMYTNYLHMYTNWYTYIYILCHVYYYICVYIYIYRSLQNEKKHRYIARFLPSQALWEVLGDPPNFQTTSLGP